MKKIFRKNVFTDRLKVDAFVLDETPEVVLQGKFFDFGSGKYVPYQMACFFEEFMKIVVDLGESHPEILNAVTEAVGGLDGEPLVIGKMVLPKGGLVLTGAVIVLAPLEYLAAGSGKWVPCLPQERDVQETGVVIDDGSGGPKFCSKLNSCEPALLLFAYLPRTSGFDLRKEWVKEIGENPKRYGIATELYELQMRFHYYLHLRTQGYSHKWSKMDAGIREERVFKLAKKCYEVN